MRNFAAALVVTLAAAAPARAVSVFGVWAKDYAYMAYSHAYFGYAQTGDAYARSAVYYANSAWFYTLYADDWYNGDGLDFEHFDHAQDLLRQALLLLDQAAARTGNPLLTTGRSLCETAANLCVLGRDDEGYRIGKVVGQITAVAATSTTIQNSIGPAGAVTVFIQSGTTVRRNGVVVPLSALQIGDRVTAQYSPATALATTIDAFGFVHTPRPVPPPSP